MKSHYRFFLLILLTKHVFAVHKQKEHSTREPNYRLEKFYEPSYYDIALNLTADVFTEKTDKFNGTVSITFQFLNVTNEVTLHADYDFITINSVRFEYLTVDPNQYYIDEITNILTINLGKRYVTVDRNYLLKIDFSSRLSTEDMYGLYRSSYVDKDGVTKFIAATMFEPTYARRAFPCFDEPEEKAVFRLELTHPVGTRALFNTRAKNSWWDPYNNLTTTEFWETPKMSSYLIAMIVSEFTCSPHVPDGQFFYQVCSRDESAGTRNFSVEVGLKLIDMLNNFTNYNYTDINKQLNQLAIPDFAAGAMENWGLVMFREIDLLWDENESSLKNKQGVATVIAHEFSHQWFGDLVTLKWWSTLFLNEGFGRYFEYHGVHEIYPEWELDKKFIVEVVQQALTNDELENAQALQSDCSTPAEITAKFGVTSYHKGASILNMLKHMIGENNFKLGLQNYIATYQYQNTEPQNLWGSFNESVDPKSEFPADITTIMENWTKLSGFPLLTVKVVGINIVITQKRFLESDTDSPSKWYVPISYTQSTSKSKFIDTTPTDWLVPSEKEIAIMLDENYDWVILNNQATAYYRVNYDDILWEKIKQALLKDNFDGIPELNRAQIVDDLFYLAKVGLQKYSIVLELLDFLAKDTSIYSWSSAFEGFNYLLQRVGANTKLGQDISNNVLTSMGNIYDSVPISKKNDTDHVYTLKQALVLEWACKVGNENCIKVSQEEFSNYKETSNRPDKNLRNVFYCYGLKYSNDDQTDWKFLWNEYINTNLATEKINILSALACTKDLVLLNDYLYMSINDSNIRSQDAATVFTSIYGNPDGVDIALEFLLNNYVKVGEKYKGMAALGKLIKGIAGFFTTDSQITKLNQFIQSKDLPEDFRVAAHEAVELAEKNVDWLNKFKQDLEDYYDH